MDFHFPLEIVQLRRMARKLAELKLVITPFSKKFTCTEPTIACTYQAQGVH